MQKYTLILREDRALFTEDAPVSFECAKLVAEGAGDGILCLGGQRLSVRCGAVTVTAAGLPSGIYTPTLLLGERRYSIPAMLADGTRLSLLPPTHGQLYRLQQRQCALEAELENAKARLQELEKRLQEKIIF